MWALVNQKRTQTGGIRLDPEELLRFDWEESTPDGEGKRANRIVGRPWDAEETTEVPFLGNRRWYWGRRLI